MVPSKAFVVKKKKKNDLTYRSANVNVESEVFGWREQQAGRHWELILLLLIFIFSIKIIDVSAQILHKEIKNFRFSEFRLFLVIVKV